MREVPLEDNAEAFAFAERLFRGEFDMMILLTGVGTRLLNQADRDSVSGGAFAGALRKLTVVARGSKPMAVLREWGVPVTVAVPEPNTWREILASIDGRSERNVAVQEYGRPSRGVDRRAAGAGRGGYFGSGVSMGSAGRLGAASGGCAEAGEWASST